MKLQYFAIFITTSAVFGESKTSSSFGNRENEDIVEVNVQISTEYQDSIDTRIETTTEIEDCNCECDCDNKNRNAAAHKIDEVGTQQFENGSGIIDDETLKLPLSGICEQFDCPNPPCQIFCEADNGYYPDSRDCRNFCFCSGNIKVPSKYQRCSGGLVWDPSCGEQGCCNWPSDSSTDHCEMV